MPVLDYTGLQYFYTQLSGKFASSSSISFLSQELINCQEAIAPLTDWRENSFDKTVVKDVVYPEFKGVAKYPKIYSSSNSQTYSLVGYSNLKLYDASNFTFSSTNNLATMNIGTQLQKGCLSLSSLNGNYTMLTTETGGGYLILPSGGTENEPLRLALQIDLNSLNDKIVALTERVNNL